VLELNPTEGDPNKLIGAIPGEANGRRVPQRQDQDEETGPAKCARMVSVADSTERGLR